MTRPAVDVVIPFRGSQAALLAVIERARALGLAPGDTLTVVDNRPAGEPAVIGVLRASERETSYHARNRGAAVGDAPWILFLDADVEAPPDLLERYFDDEPGERTAVLAGAIEDGPGTTLAARYQRLAHSMAQASEYAKTANCAIRRAAFTGFVDNVRSGGDADLCFRLRDAGWAIEPRPRAAVVHRSRATLRALVRQRARHGAGAAWLERRYPGSFPSRLGPGMLTHTARQLARATRACARADRDAATLAAVGVLTHWAFELGRLLRNEV